MTGRVAVRLPGGRGGWRRGCAKGAAPAKGGPGAPTAPAPDRIPRVARVLALAHHWQGLIRAGVVRNQADLARLVGVSRARVTQIMDLLNLAPDIQNAVLNLRRSFEVLAGVHERDLRSVAAEPVWSTQRRLALTADGPCAAAEDHRR